MFPLIGEYNYDGLYSRLFSSYPCLVEVSAHSVSNDALLAFGTYPRLELKTLNMELKVIENNNLIRFFGCWPSLTSLTLSGHYGGMTDEDVRVIVERCPLLSKLCLLGSSEITDLSLSYILSLVNLIELDMSSLDNYYTDGSGMTSEGLQSLVNARPSIQVLKCLLEQGGIDSFLRCVGTYCLQLRVLVVEKNEEIAGCSHAAVIALVQACPLLEGLEIDGYSPNDGVLYAISERCAHLSRLGMLLYEPAAFTDQGLIALSRGCPGLIHLHLHDAPDITDAAIMSFAEHCHQLESLDLDGNHLITSQAICALLKANPGITSIEVSDCTFLDDNVILTLAHYCPKLRILSMLCCVSLSIEPLYTLARSCRSLVDVIIAVSVINDEFIDILTQRCKGLQKIRLYECPNITGYTLGILLLSGMSLTHISIYRCGLHANDMLRRYYYMSSHPRAAHTHTEPQPQGCFTKLRKSICQWLSPHNRHRHRRDREGQMPLVSQAVYCVSLSRTNKRMMWAPPRSTNS